MVIPAIHDVYCFQCAHCKRGFFTRVKKWKCGMNYEVNLLTGESKLMYCHTVRKKGLSDGLTKCNHFRHEKEGKKNG